MKKNSFILALIFLFVSQIFSNTCFLPYQVNQSYASGSQVSYQGKNYQAKWWTVAIPGTQTWMDADWEDLGKCEVETNVDLTTDEEQEKTTLESVSQFLLFATNDLNLNSGVKIAGNIGANRNVSVGMAAGWQTIINGDIYSKGKVSTSAEASINGNVYAQNLELGWQAKHDGELIKNFDYDFNIEKKTFQAGSQNIDGKWRENLVLSSGSYGNISVRDGGSLQLSKGTYNAKTLSLNSNDLEIKLNISAGENVYLNIQDSLHLGSGAKVKFAGKKSPLNFKIYTNQTKDLIIPDHSEINAIITAPNAKVIVNSGAKVNGAIFAKEIEVKYGAIINGVPFITDIFHSEYHFAPNFDVMTAEYLSVISPSANIEFVEVNAPSKYKVTKSQSGEKYIFEIEDIASGLVSYYTIDFRKNANNAVFVNSSKNGNGSSWSSALKSLSEAIKLAKETGKEIRVAEGNYGNITIGQGTKIIGGYSGEESGEEEPQGSPYETILDGAKIKQTIIINGFANSKSVKIKGLTVQNGHSETNGGGISSEKVIPKFEEIIVKNNTAKESGAGIYAPKGVQDLQMVLLENNTGKSAFYLDGKDSIRAEKVVISGNSGVGLEAKNANLTLINSIFYGNKTAISAEKSSFEIIHNTFAKNDTGIVSKNSTVKIINTILWNEKKELEGNEVKVEYSCVKGGFSGEGNIGDDPMFVDIENPKGNDGEWRTLDDGLSLKRESPCIDKGTETEISNDFIDMERPLGDDFDMGAYEIAVLLEGDIIDYGILTKDNEFIFREDIGDVIVGLTRRDLYRKVYTKSALTLRVFAEKNKYTDVEHKKAKVVFRDQNGRNVGREIEVDFWRNRDLSTSSHYAFTSRRVMNGKVEGKVLFLVVGDISANSSDPFYTLKVIDSVSDNQEYVDGSIYITVSK